LFESVASALRWSLAKQRLERVKRFELSTSTLARLRSTPELHPLAGR
jgi:hypothetical protein